MFYVTDTSSNLYLSDKLPDNINEIFMSAEEESVIFVPTVLAECLYLVENEKIELDFNDLMKNWRLAITCSNVI